MEKTKREVDRARGWDKSNVRVRLAFCCWRFHNRDEDTEEDIDRGSEQEKKRMTE